MLSAHGLLLSVERYGQVVLFLSEKAQQFEDAIRFESFLAQLRRDVPHSPKFAAFLAWADEHIEGLRESLSAQAIDEDLRESELFA
jgi:hypothetical protein